jgi:multicomponent Na+:H+ antiporter subunit D
MTVFKQIILMLPVCFGLLSGALYAGVRKKDKDQPGFSAPIVIGLISVQFVLSVLSLVLGAESVTLFSLTSKISLSFNKDIVATGFSGLVSVMFFLTGIYAVFYMRHDDNKRIESENVNTLHARTFFGFYLIVWAVLVGLGYTANLVSFYFLYEIMSVTSVILVMHEMTKEAIYASKKYLYYSIGGASMSLFGMVALYNITGGSLKFIEGGDPAFSLLNSMTAGKHTLVLIAVLMMIIGFGAKAGMFPLHGWLPTAHPVAPAPASAVLSGVITKAGVLGIFRVIYFIAGTSELKGTWVQHVFIALTLATVFMGSMLAYKEKVFKKRLAYSTVSQVSYVLFGIACMNPLALMGAFLHVMFHSVLKTTLFLNAGTVIYASDKHEVTEFTGIGKQLPLTFLSFSVAALGLVGIPPICGFVSKWYLCLGSLDLNSKAEGYLGVAVLLISALLTAGYLLSITIVAFFPGEDFDNKEGNYEKDGRVPKGMIVVMLVLAIASILLGIMAKPFYNALFDFVYRL